MATVTYSFDATIATTSLPEFPLAFDQAAPTIVRRDDGGFNVFFREDGIVTMATFDAAGVIGPTEFPEIVTFSSAISGPLAACALAGGFAVAANNEAWLEVVLNDANFTSSRFNVGTGLAQSFGVAQLGSQILAAAAESDVAGASVLTIVSFQEDGSQYLDLEIAAATNAISDVAVATLSSGRVIVVNSFSGGGSESLAGRIVDQGFLSPVAEFDIDLGGHSIDDQATVLALDGKFVVAWRSDRGGEETDIYYRVFDNSGVALTGPVLVTGLDGENARRPTLAHLGGDDFIVGWEYELFGGSDIDVRFTVANATAGPANFLGHTVNGDLGGGSDDFTSLFAFQSGDDELAPRFAALADGSFLAFAEDPDGVSGGISYRGLSLTRRTEGEDNVNDVLTGDGLRDTLVGKSGDDILDGKGGVDTMEGGAGDDFYRLDRADDIVTELAGEGDFDFVEIAFGGSYTLPTHVEGARVDGDAKIDITGNARDNSIRGNGEKNVLRGLGGDDTLDGATDSGDRMIGGTGSDNYAVDKGDIVDETTGGGGVNDHVFAYNTSWTLGAGLEHLTLTSDGAFNGKGNALDNIITGGAGANTLTGGRGADTLTGLQGKDKFDFNAVNETGKTKSTRDVIEDFTRGKDKIDLATIDANGSAAGHKFSFLKSEGASFTGAKGQLRFDIQNNAGKNNDRTVVEGDVNGDRKADFQIELTGLISLKDADFVL